MTTQPNNIDRIKTRMRLVRSWLALADLVLMYEEDVQNGRADQTVINRRADAIAAFRSVEKEIGIEQSLPVRIR